MPQFLKEGINRICNFQRRGDFKQVSTPWGEYGYFKKQHIFNREKYFSSQKVTYINRCYNIYYLIIMQNFLKYTK